MVLQFGVYVQELLTGLLYEHVVAVSANTTRSNPCVRHVIPHGFDDAVFTLNAEPRTPEPSVLFVGTLDGRKRGQMLLDGFLRTIRSEHPAASLTIVGPAGPAHPGVHYRTGVSDAELAQLYRRSWVYASPSTYEGFGLPYLEAMACGTPVVATPNPGSAEVLADGVYGLLPADEDFVHQVSALLGDDARRSAFSASGVERARAYSLSVMLDRYEALLRPLVSVHVKSIASA
jgi:glycosyltransferase involved in cell wall biosynthesis